MTRVGLRLCWLAMLLAFLDEAVLISAAHGQLAPAGRTALDHRIDSSLIRARLLPESGQSIEALENVLATEKLDANQKARVDKELFKYREYQLNDLVRQGPTNWIPATEAEQLAAAADSLIERGVSYLVAGNHTSAKEAFEDASKKDRAGTRADFVLGILNSPLGPEKPSDAKEWKEFFKAAEGHFRQVLVRSPDLSCVVNDLALIYVRQKRFKEALLLWKELNKAEPDSPIVLHNVTELVEQINKGRVFPGKTDEKAIQLFYTDLTAGAIRDRVRHSPGWWYTNLTLSQSEEKRTRFDETAVNAPAGSGTGFVVHPGYLLTAAHLVADANSVSVALGDQLPVAAETLVISLVHDLAILKLPDDTVPALSFSATTPEATDYVTQIGFPSQSSRITPRSFKISASPNITHHSKLLLFQGIVNPGLIGAPVCDSSGNVIGMSTTIGTLDKGLTPSIPTSMIDTFIEKHLPEYKAMRRTELNPVAADQLISRTSGSIGRVMVTKRYHNFGFGTAANPTFAVDLLPSCCVGTGKVECGGCNSSGEVSVKKMVQVGVNKLTGKPQFQLRGVKQKCPTCAGDGLVPCPFGGSRLH